MFNNSLLSVFFRNPLEGIILIGSFVFSLTIHEFCHALAADKLGDPTPRANGRLSLNPMAHLDPLGTIALLVAGFGWAKPVPIDPYNLKDPQKETALIALAGPASNFAIAIVLSLLFRLNLVPNVLIADILLQTIVINLVLGIFNFVPVPPLDGSKIVLAILPKEVAYEYEAFMHQFGMFVLLALILPLYQGMAPISFLISPVIKFAAQLLVGFSIF